MRNTVLISALAVLLLGGILYFGGFFEEKPLEYTEQARDDYPEKEYTNERGEHWYLSQEPRSEFTVAAREDEYPKFVSGAIEPLDVQPGDVHNLELIFIHPRGD